MRLRKISFDFFPHPLLRTSQTERQSLDQNRSVATLLVRPKKRRCRAGFSLAIVLTHRDLLREQLVKFYAPPRRRGAGAEPGFIGPGTRVM